MRSYHKSILNLSKTEFKKWYNRTFPDAKDADEEYKRLNPKEVKKV